MSYTQARSNKLTDYYQAKEGWWIEQYGNIHCIFFQSNTGYCPNTILIK